MTEFHMHPYVIPIKSLLLGTIQRRVKSIKTSYTAKWPNKIKIINIISVLLSHENILHTRKYASSHEGSYMQSYQILN